MEVPWILHLDDPSGPAHTAAEKHGVSTRVDCRWGRKELPRSIDSAALDDPTEIQSYVGRFLDGTRCFVENDVRERVWERGLRARTIECTGREGAVVSKGD